MRLTSRLARQHLADDSSVQTNPVLELQVLEAVQALRGPNTALKTAG